MSARGPGLRAVLAEPGYRRLWAARTVSQWGDIVQTVTLALLVYELTGSSLGALGVSGAGYGTLLAAIGVGAAFGPLALLRLIPDPRRRAFVFGPLALRGVVDLVLAATARLPVAAAALASYGLATSTGAVTFASVLQAETPDALRGRVFASMDLLWETGRLASLGVAGMRAETVGIRAVYALGGVLLLVAAAYGFTSSRRPRATASGQ